MSRVSNGRMWRLTRRLAYLAELLEPMCYPCPYPRCVSPATIRREW